jgi:hypothetical protein
MLQYGIDPAHAREQREAGSKVVVQPRFAGG